MSLKNKFFSVLTLAVATVAFSTIGFGQDKTTTTTPTAPEKSERPMRGEGRGFGKGEGHKGFGRGGRREGMMRMMHDLNLTDAQKAQIKSIREANRPDAAVMQELRTLGKAKHDGTITAEQQTRLEALRNQAHEKGKSVHEQILGVFTAEQKAQIETRKAEMKQHMEERRQRRQERKATTPAATTTTDKPKDN